jgi:hypothetical protein
MLNKDDPVVNFCSECKFQKYSIHTSQLMCSNPKLVPMNVVTGELMQMTCGTFRSSKLDCAHFVQRVPIFKSVLLWIKSKL